MENKKIQIQFRDSKDKILKECHLSRIPGLDEKVVLKYDQKAKRTINSNEMYRVYDVITMISDDEEGYVIYIASLNEYFKMLQKTKEIVKND